MAGDQIVDGFRKSLDENEICMMADAAVTMEEEFLLDIISDIDPTASVYCKTSAKPERKSTRQIAQRRRSEALREDINEMQADIFKLHRGDDASCMSPDSSMSSSCASSVASGESSSGWTVVPVVTPEQMFALGRMVKEQRSCSSSLGSSSFSIGSVEAGG